MILLTTNEMEKMDKLTIKNGFPEILLMETAGRGVAELGRDILEEKGKSSIFVVCGKGNNGGDGFVSARFLDIWGYDVSIFLAGKGNKLKGVSKTNYELCDMRDIDIYEKEWFAQGELDKLLKNSDLIIDAMLGTGLKGEVRGIYAELINKINETKGSLILSVDIPSGLNGDSGQVHGRAIKADYTATMAFSKLGLAQYPARDYTGDIYVIDLGMPQEVINKVGYNHFLLEEKEAQKLLPFRPANGHKGTFGRIGVIGGSSGMTGAPVLAGMAALKSGSGLVQLLVPGEIQDIAAGYFPELITEALPSSKGQLDERFLELLERINKDYDVLAVGPGLGKGIIISKVISSLISDYEKKIVLDADGINAISNLSILKNTDAELILTPHPGEMARLLDVDVSYIQKNRIKISRDFAVENEVNLILKGAATTIALPDGNVYINITGNSGLATAGSGDVLTGITASLLGQGLESSHAAVLAPYIHGLCGDFGADDMSTYSLSASDLLNFLPDVLNSLQYE
ncbi:MAG: NAD(P)H-hydrate dehydratase [Halanaerobiales bacterium]